MERSVRIAVVGPVDDRLVGDLRQLPLHPEVRTSSSLVRDSDGLLRQQPDVLVIGLGEAPEEEIGALRLLRQLWPTLGVVLVTSAALEVSQTPLAKRLHALLLVYPDSPGQLAAIIEQARLLSDRPRAEVFVDLARGIADEINNPLMFASGHLQLLRASFEGLPERSRRDQVAAVLAGIARITASVDRLRSLSQAANGPRRREPVDLALLLQNARDQTDLGEGEQAAMQIEPGPHVMRGDVDQLTLAMAEVVRFADDLAKSGATSVLHLYGGDQAQTVSVVATGSALASWQLPTTFEPYYPSRALRGQSQGLGLFLLQTVVLGHRGQATVRRRPDGALHFDFVLPA